jgi:hypothetical protein
MNVFSHRADVVRDAIRKNPDCVNTRVPFTPLINAIQCKYSRSIIKALLDSGASPTMTLVHSSRCWIVRRMLLQHMPSIAHTVHSIHYLYMKAPKAEREWFKHFSAQRIRFVLSVTPELIQRATEAQATPPLYVGGVIIPGRQGYQDAMSHAVTAGLIAEELSTEEPLRCPLLEPEPEPEPEPQPRVKYTRSKFYNHPLWPSPRAKCYVLALKKHPNFTSSWQASGLPQKITHDICLAYIAWLLRISLEELLRTPHDEMGLRIMHNLNHPLIKREDFSPLPIS